MKEGMAMYTEEYERRGFPVKSFLLKAIILIILAFLLAWLLPKVNMKHISTSVTQSEMNKSLVADEIFLANIDRIKKIVVSYYTKERLSQEVTTSATLSLDTMMEKKLIGTLVDESNKPYDTKKSYMKLTKIEDGYLLKINLKSAKKEEYMLFHLDSYAYCSTDICEKKTIENMNQ